MKRSTPSATPNPPSDRKSSGGKWTIPRPADVISYSYLWAREAAEGEESGRKDRPVVVVVSATVRDGRIQLLVAPITHSAPVRSSDGIEIPASVKKQLGLDSERCWTILTELNRFIWPGPDIRIAPGQESPLYDALPDWLFIRIRDGIVALSDAGRLEMTKRSE